MNRSSTRTVADYQGNAFARAVFQSADDSQLQQEVTLQLLTGEAQQTLEHWLPYGYTHVPIAPSGNPTVAETIVAFLIGRSHGIALPFIDRRFRLGNLQPGDTAHYDHLGHHTHFAGPGNSKPPGVYRSAPNDKLHQTRVMKDTASAIFGQLKQLADFAGQFGQTPWLPHPIHSYKHHDKNVHQHQHPNTVNHHIISGDAVPPSSGGAGGLAGMPSQLAGIVSQFTSMAGVNGVVPAINSLGAQITALTAQATTANGATAAMVAVTGKINAIAAQMIATTSMTGMPALASQLSTLSSQFSSASGGLSGLISQIIHIHSLDQLKGILHSAFKNQHTTTHNQKGVTSTSSVAVTDVAQQINHDGNTNVNATLTVAYETNSPIYTNASDRRLKTNIVDHHPVLDSILKLEVKEFDEYLVMRSHEGHPIIDKTTTRKMVGFVAQDLQKIFPHEVTSDRSHLQLLSVAEGKIAVRMVKAFQEFVAESRSEIAGLKARVAMLEAKHG